MSKEQTPITADYIKKEILKGLSEVFRGKTIYMKDIEVSIEKYAQAKVLEALERVEKENEYVRLTSERGKTSIDKDYYNGMKWAHDRIKNVIETEVKPKYK